MPAVLKRLNVIAECRSSRLGLWSCPPFLFIVMGLVNIAAMTASWLLASRLAAEPEIAALVVIAVSLIIFVIGTFIIHGFNQVADANRIKSEFVAIVSHQLRSPLSVFKWTLDALGRAASSRQPSAPLPAAGEVPEVDRSHLDILRENTEKMIQLVNVLLEVSRIEAGRLILRHEPVHLGILTDEIVRSYDAYARASNVALEYAHPAALPPVDGDPERVRMIITNLLDNAVRYSSPGGGRVAITIAPCDHASLEWKISDSGIGIPSDEQRRIFQKFFRASTGAANQTEGSGLGLYIARSLVEALGGQMGFTSRDRGGTTFWFRLPVYT